MDHDCLTRDLFFATLRAASADDHGTVLYAPQPSADQSPSPIAREFSNRYASALLKYYRQLPTEDARTYFKSFLGEQLISSGSIVCATLLRAGELEVVAARLETWVYFTRNYASCLEAIAHTIQYEDELFSEAQLERLRAMCSRIQERIALVKEREAEHDAYLEDHPQDLWAAWRSGPDMTIMTQIEEMTVSVKGLVVQIPFKRYERLILASGTPIPPRALTNHLQASSRIRGHLAPLGHLNKAHAFLGGPHPDFPNAAKEAISAVEAMAKIITGEPHRTLGQLIPRLKDQYRMEREIASILQTMWGYTSDSPGVRHGGATPPSITAPVARYVVQISEAAVEFLTSLESAPNGPATGAA